MRIEIGAARELPGENDADIAIWKPAGNNGGMDAIRFNTVIGEDHVIRVPDGVPVPQGPVEVTVAPRQADTTVPTDVKQLSNWLLEFAAEAERCPAELPSDMAENHDYYAHGKPRE